MHSLFTLPYSLMPYDESFRHQLIHVWELSVNNTHHFLLESDFDEIKEMVKAIDFSTLKIFCLFHEDTIAGFIGIAKNKVEMLFLEPSFTGKGLGKKLMQFAIKGLHINEVDVNEQNENAVAFYQKLGFESYERTPTDSLGKNYPILKMKLKS